MRGTATPYSRKDNWSDTYLTPRALVGLLGPFDLDPACPPKMPWRTARRMLTPKSDGLKAKWRGRVWLNPPFKNVAPWCEKFAAHRSGIILLNGRATETRHVHAVLRAAAALYLPSKRLAFSRTDGVELGAWFPSLLIGMGDADVRAFERIAGNGRDAFGGEVLYTRRML